MSVTELHYVDDGTDALPKLRDPSYRYTTEDLRSMQNELVRLLNSRPSINVKEISFTNPPDGLPEDWTVERHEGSDGRTYELVLRPRQSITEAERFPVSQDTLSHRSDMAHESSVESLSPSTPIWVDELLDSFEEIGRDASHSATHCDVAETVHRSALTTIRTMFSKQPEAASLILYDSLVRTLVSIKEADCETDSYHELQLVLSSLEPLRSRLLQKELNRPRTADRPQRSMKIGLISTVLSVFSLAD